MERYEAVAKDPNYTKLQKRRWRKRMGLPVVRHLGSPETKVDMKRIRQIELGVHKVQRLVKRGLLKKGYGIPKRIDEQVEATETQTVSTLVRAKDGLLQIIPRRRKRVDVEKTPIEFPDGHPEPKIPSRMRRPVM